jgi:small subunit ribosomal protein S21
LLFVAARHELPGGFLFFHGRRLDARGCCCDLLSSGCGRGSMLQPARAGPAALCWRFGRSRAGEEVNRAMAEVIVQEGETLESALRRFKRKVQQEDIIKEIKKHSYYVKPGEKRRLKQALARKRSRKKRAREMD